MRLDRLEEPHNAILLLIAQKVFIWLNKAFLGFESQIGKASVLGSLLGVLDSS